MLTLLLLTKFEFDRLLRIDEYQRIRNRKAISKRQQTWRVANATFHQNSRKRRTSEKKNNLGELRRLLLLKHREYDHLARKEDNHGELLNLYFYLTIKAWWVSTSIKFAYGMLKHAHASKHSNQSCLLMRTNISQSLSMVQSLPTFQTTQLVFGIRTDCWVWVSWSRKPYWCA